MCSLENSLLCVCVCVCNFVIVVCVLWTIGMRIVLLLPQYHGMCVTTKTKSLFPLMPLPFEPLIHFNPMFLDKSASVSFIFAMFGAVFVLLHFVFVWLLFNSVSCHFFCCCLFLSSLSLCLSCSLCLDYCLLFIHFNPTNVRSFVIADGLFSGGMQCAPQSQAIGINVM